MVTRSEAPKLDMAAQARIVVKVAVIAEVKLALAEAPPAALEDSPISESARFAQESTPARMVNFSEELLTEEGSFSAQPNLL